MNGNFLYAIAVGVCVGIALELLGCVSFFVPIFFLFVSCAFLFFGAHRKKFFIVAVACASVVLGLVRADAFLAAESQKNFNQYIGASAIVSGVVADDPDRRDTSLHVTLDVEKINGKELPASEQGTMLAILPRDTSLAYGDHVEVRGLVVAPKTFETNNGREFDYPGYLRAHGISALVQHASLQKVSVGSWSLQKFLFSLKHSFEHALETVMLEPHASLMNGILLGERSGIPSDLMQAFITSGLVHVVALSGYNITIVSEGVLRVLSFLPRAMSASLGGVMMLLFALMTGGGSTTIRACIMALIAILARYFHRPTIAMRSLAVAAAVMAIWNPLVLLYDPSFILSVLATLGLIMLSPWVERWLSHFFL